jgi:hypothetical protein
MSEILFDHQSCPLNDTVVHYGGVCVIVQGRVTDHCNGVRSVITTAN